MGAMWPNSGTAYKMLRRPGEMIGKSGEQQIGMREQTTGEREHFLSVLRIVQGSLFSEAGEFTYLFIYY